MLGRAGHEREDVVLGFLEQRGDLRQAGLELSHRLGETGPRVLVIGSAEDGADQRAEDVMLVLARVAAQVTQEVDRAALPYARKNPSATSEPAFRMLQILTRLRGDKPTL